MPDNDEFLTEHPKPWHVQRAPTIDVWSVNDANGIVLCWVDDEPLAKLIAAIPETQEALVVSASWPASSRAKELVLGALEKSARPIGWKDTKEVL